MLCGQQVTCVRSSRLCALTMQGWQGNTRQGHTLPAHDVACSAEAATAATAILAAAAATLEAEQRSAAEAQNAVAVVAAENNATSADVTPDSKVRVVRSTICLDDMEGCQQLSCNWCFECALVTNGCFAHRSSTRRRSRCISPHPSTRWPVRRTPWTVAREPALQPPAW
jgi:hypothetical protein